LDLCKYMESMSSVMVTRQSSYEGAQINVHIFWTSMQGLEYESIEWNILL